MHRTFLLDFSSLFECFPVQCRSVILSQHYHQYHHHRRKVKGERQKAQEKREVPLVHRHLSPEEAAPTANAMADGHTFVFTFFFFFFFLTWHQEHSLTHSLTLLLAAWRLAGRSRQCTPFALAGTTFLRASSSSLLSDRL